MQKRILYILLAISIFGILSATITLYIIQTNMAYTRAHELFDLRFADVEERMNENEEQIAKLIELTKMDYIARARALAMILEQEPEILNDIDRLHEIAAALDVDEIHIIDENGFLQWGTVPEYYGKHFDESDQTREFLAILDDPTLEIAQNPMPNGYDQMERQYAAVSMRGQKGIVEIGMVPERLANALARNTMDKVLANITVGRKGYLISVDDETGLITSHPNKRYINSPQLHRKDRGYITVEGERKYYDSRLIGTQMVSAVIPLSEMFADRVLYTGVILLSMIIIFGVFFLTVNYHIRKNIVSGIHETLETLEKITGGDLNTVAQVRINDEFDRLSDGINHMVRSIKDQIEEITALGEDKGRLAAIISMADAGVILKDKDNTVVQWNIGAENILGYSAEEMIGKTAHLYTPKESYFFLEEIDNRLKAGESTARADSVRRHKDGHLVDVSSSYTPIMNEDNEFNGSVAIFHDVSDKKRLEFELQQAMRKVEEKHRAVMDGIDYASRIQHNLLPDNSVFNRDFADFSVIWEPRDVVGGDIYWVKNFAHGTLLTVCDCTGHGTAGAILTMLVASTLDTIADESNCHDTAALVYLLDRKISTVLNVETDGNKRSKVIRDGCDVAILYISRDGSVTFSAAKTHVFICDGEEVRQTKGQSVFVGEGSIKSKDDIKSETLPPDPRLSFYIASDGLFDQMGGNPPRPFGYRQFKDIVLKNHHETQGVISAKIYEAFEAYRGDQQRRDDLELITFKTRGRG